MKKFLKTRIEEIERSAKYKVMVNMGWDEKTKSYPRKSRIVYGTKREAEAYLRNWVHELENPTEEEAKSDETVAEWLDFWMENDVNLLLSWEQNTTTRAKGIIKNNIKPYVGDTLLSELNADNILNMYKVLSENGGRYGKGLAPRTLRYIHTILNQALNQAVVRGKIEENPAKGLMPAVDKVKNKDKWVILDAKQLSSFLGKCKDHRDYPVIYTAAYTGMRQSEIIGLTIDKILWKKCGIEIKQTLHRTQDKEEYELRERTKNETSTRMIDISPKVIEFLLEHIEQQKLKGIPTGPNDLLFTEPTGKPINSGNLSKRYKKLTARLGHEGMSFHHLRHTHATILLSAGAYINAVAERLGHSDPRITLAIYGHVLPSSRSKLANHFDEIMKE